MSYNYQTERPALFTEEGQVRFLKVRDKVQAAIKAYGAFRVQELGVGSWEDMACLDRMVELKELVALRAPGSCWAQFQVYTTPQVHNY
jgi:hypothetical protein